MTALGAFATIAAVIVVWFAPRDKALLGMVAGALFLTQGLQVNAGGFNIFAFRFLELVGFFRVLTRKEFSFSQLTRLDRILLIFYTYLTVVFVIRADGGYVYQIGIAIDGLLTYFTFRGLISGVGDFSRFLASFLGIFAIYVLIVLVERYTRYNAFVLLGADTPHDPGAWDRKGMPRCFGSFRHPSLLGTIGGAMLPFYVSLWFGRAKKFAAFVGANLCLLIVWASNSGGPLNCVAVGIIGWGLWIVRQHMRKVRWGLLVFVFAMGAAMNSPIWYLPARASSMTGGDGWHRSYLMDIAYQNLDKWWFAGMPMEETRSWFPYLNAGTGNADLTNVYLVYGLNAGLPAMVLFFILLIAVFSQLGKAMQVVRSRFAQPVQAEYMLWGLGVMIVIHCINWLGITYFDQSYAFWFMQLAAVASLTNEFLQPEIPTKRELASG